MERYLKAAVLEDLQEKMVFLGGPRQVGKTTFALSLLTSGSETHPAYLSWDNLAASRKIRDGLEVRSAQEAPQRAAHTLVVIDDRDVDVRGAGHRNGRKIGPAGWTVHCP